MGIFGSFLPRLVALTFVWLLAAAALTSAATRRIGTPRATTTSTQASVPSQARPLVVPDVRRQAFVFAKGTLGDAGFSFRVDGSVHGYPSNLVSAEAPAPGTRLVDTGAPTIVLHLSRSGQENGIPQDISTIAGTAVRLADLAAFQAPAPAAVPVAPVVKVAPAKKTAAVKKAAAVKRAAPTKKAAPVKKAAAVKKAAPVKQAPKQHRPPAFVVAGANREPLDEMPLTARARMLLTWIDGRPQSTDANVHHWLYQHAWIVIGAQMGWWHGAEALKTLETVDQHVQKTWGIGALSEALAQRALAEVEAKS